MSRSSTATPSFFRSAMLTESREITAQIENAILVWCQSIGVSCFYKTAPADLKPFASYLGAISDKKDKENFLIDHGLAVASAVSFFFENIVQFENAGISNNCVMQLLNLNTVRDDQISLHDVQYFPYLRDASTYNCSALFHDPDAIKWFDNLDKNKIFCEKSYGTFLKIMLTPDTFIRKIFRESISDENVAINISLHFLRRKGFLKQCLQKNEKFKLWWEKLSASDVQLLFHEFSPGSDLQKANALFQRFSQEMAVLKIENCFSLLTQLIDLSIDEVSMENKFPHVIGLYVPVVGLREALSHLCQSFFQDAELSADSIAQFTRKATNMLNGFEALPFVIDRNKNAKLNAFLRETRDTIRHLKRSLADSEDEFEKIDCREESDDIECATRLTPANLVRAFTRWLEKRDDLTNTRLENKLLVSNIFKEAYAAYQKKPTTVVAQTGSALVSVASFTSSWVSSRIFSTPVLRAVTPRHDLDQFADKITAVTHFDALVQVMSELLSLQGKEIESLHTQFVSGLMKQFVREFLAKQYLMRMQYNPRASLELRKLLTVPVPDSDVLEAAALFIKKMQPESVPCLGSSKEWMVVERTSDTSFEGAREEEDVFAELTHMRHICMEELGDAAQGFDAHAV